MEPLSAPVTTLPHFMPNQVLTETQLNGVADYLEQQERFTRERLIGIGIVCGLQASLVTKAEVQNATVSRGVGISSAGYLLNLPHDLPLTKQRPFDPKNYKPFAGIKNCIELLPDDTSATGATDISVDPSDSVFVLFLDIQEKPNGKCLGENCDEKGNSYVFTLRVLIIPIEDAEQVIRSAYPINEDSTLENYFNPAYSLPTVFIERFGDLSSNNNGGYFDLPDIQDFDTFENDYRLVIKNGAQRLDAAIAKAFDIINMSFMFKDIFGKQLDPNNIFSAYFPTSLSDRCTLLLDRSKTYYKKGNCQYIYDFLRDLIDTYHELRDELFSYYAACCPRYGLFPRHLFLGLTKEIQFGRLVPADFEQPYHYRDKFIPSHAQTIEVQYLRRIKQLIQRLQLQITELDLSAILSNGFGQETELISIIPDKTHAAPLGDRSIPFYYNDKDQSLYKYWNYDKLVQNRPFENRSYFAGGFQYPPGLDSSYMTSPVLFDIAKYPKFTIQGHVGMPLSQAVTDLQDLRLRYNLSFDILLLKLGSLNTGGIIADDNLIADLQAQYLAYRNELVCCVEDLINYIDTGTNKKLIAEFFLVMLEALLTKNNAAGTNTNAIKTIPATIEKILDAFNLSLALMVKSLPDDIKLFRFQKLYEIYPAVSSFTSLFKLIITSWGDLEGLIVDAKLSNAIPGAEIITIMLNIWELYLDKIADDCVLANFLTISELYQERVSTFSYFSKFNEQVHGMEHISGTTNGGTFILVYDNAKRSKRIYRGKIVSENGHALAGAMIMDARDHAVMLTKTAADGTFEAEVPDDAEAIAIQHKDFTVQEIQLSNKNLGTAKLYSHDSYVKDVNVNLPPVANETDKVYIDLMSAASQFKEIAATAAAAPTEKRKTTLSNADQKIQASRLAEILTIEKPRGTFSSVVVNSKTEFVVVADFSLPHPIHNYKTAVKPFDACKRLKGVKLIDFTAMSALLSKNTKTFDTTAVWSVAPSK